jgi:hypothetical protein
MTSAVDDAVPADGYAPYSYPPPKLNPFSRFFVRLYSAMPTWTAPVAILTCFAGAVVYTSVSVPQYFEGAEWAQPTCLVKLTIGQDCPGCGGTRAFFYLMHGNLPAAARHHAMFVFAFPFLAYLYIAWSMKVVFGRQLPVLRLSPKVIGGFIIAWMGFSIIRNVPMFSWLYV